MTAALGLTAPQRRFLDFLRTYRAQHGYSPSYVEIGDALGIAKSGIHRLAHQLEKRGHVRFEKNSSRSIVPLVETAAQGSPDLLQAWSRADAQARSDFLKFIGAHQQLGVVIDVRGRIN
ncbi:MAG TPA: MarR family transcriptional regulator [Mesorhizobium sp.]|jgi:SOS-response transcriptional repressor LexA|nr:MarR family transcriptional regulator [Mesorhizobium sp.]